MCMGRGEMWGNTVAFLHLFTFTMFVIWQVARRCWSGNSNAYETICQAMEETGKLKVTLPHKVVDESILEQALHH